MCRFRVYSLGFWVRRFECVMEGMFLSKQSPCKRTVIYKGPLAGSILILLVNGELEPYITSPYIPL